MFIVQICSQVVVHVQWGMTLIFGALWTALDYSLVPRFYQPGEPGNEANGLCVVANTRGTHYKPTNQITLLWLDHKTPPIFIFAVKARARESLLSAGELGAGEFKGGTSTWRVRKPRESLSSKENIAKQLEWVTNRTTCQFLW